MALNKIAFAVLAMASVSAFAASKAALCVRVPVTAEDLVSQCAPEVTFFAAGGIAMRDFYKFAMSTMFDPSKPVVYIKTLNADGSTENKNQFAMYGFGKADADASIAGKRLAIMVNTLNGSMAGVNMLLSGAKTGSLLNNVDGKEYQRTIALQSVDNMGKGIPYFPDGAGLTGTDGSPAYILPNVAANLPNLKLLTLNYGISTADLKTGWGVDKTKTVGIAFTDVRPNEAVPGQLVGGKWDRRGFPYIPIAMQGFQVIVNNNLYNALVKRDIAERRLPSSCEGVMAVDCQPTIFSAEMTSLMMGKRPAGWDAATPVTLQRRVDSSGTQAAAQIFFASVPNPDLDKTVRAFAPVLGANLVDGQFVRGMDSSLTIEVNSNTDSVVSKVANSTTADAGYVLGVVSSDRGSNPLFCSAYCSYMNIKSYSVKIDGFSPNAGNFDSPTGFDITNRTALTKGYPFQFEFGVVTNAKNKGAQKVVADAFIAAMRNEAIFYRGVVFKGTGAGQSPYSRGGNNFNPLSQY
ncbi:hypothetical protein [Limnohabitans sp.]|uniref:hypothetical protein n=1 Tax=Limnohabitans sp. TaxID=1907725 RepID=UPI0038BDEF26